jgi:uncharacterized protein
MPVRTLDRAGITNPTLKTLREQAIASSLFPPTTLRRAVERLGFVQVDPIASPARSQDLVLRHRVENYRLGDIERRYRELRLEEDRLYAFGFMPRSTFRLVHPRTERVLTKVEARVLAIVGGRRRVHPRDLEVHFGRTLERNDWGGQSKVTTRILHRLHYRGFLRVLEREGGVRVYELARPKEEDLVPADRFRRLVLLVAAILGPLPEQSLRTTLGYVAYHAPALRGLRSAIPALLDSGELREASVEGVRYLWPPPRASPPGTDATVRFLSPFDPLVWDRRRFELWWGWPYRFEAYVPARRREFGYYAMPMLWRDEVVGWVNVLDERGRFAVLPGFRRRRPSGPEFRREYEAEVARLEAFLEAGERHRGRRSPPTGDARSSSRPSQLLAR